MFTFYCIVVNSWETEVGGWVHTFEPMFEIQFEIRINGGYVYITALICTINSYILSQIQMLLSL